MTGSKTKTEYVCGLGVLADLGTKFQYSEMTSRDWFQHL